MQRRQADRAIGWSRVVERSFTARRVEKDSFTGWRSALLFTEVRKPLWVDFRGVPYCVCDEGYLWVQYFPDGARHTVTCMFDGDGAIIQWYIDICAAWGVSDDGMPWFDDLYLDIVITPVGDVELLDADELEQALVVGLVSREAYDLAWREARWVQRLIEEGRLLLIERSVADLPEIRCELSLVRATLPPTMKCELG